MPGARVPGQLDRTDEDARAFNISLREPGRRTRALAAGFRRGSWTGGSRARLASACSGEFPGDAVRQPRDAEGHERRPDGARPAQASPAKAGPDLGGELLVRRVLSLAAFAAGVAACRLHRPAARLRERGHLSALPGKSYLDLDAKGSTSSTSASTPSSTGTGERPAALRTNFGGGRETPGEKGPVARRSGLGVRCPDGAGEGRPAHRGHPDRPAARQAGRRRRSATSSGALPRTTASSRGRI